MLQGKENDQGQKALIEVKLSSCLSVLYLVPSCIIYLVLFFLKV